MGHLLDDAIANLAVFLDHESLVHKLLPTAKEFLSKCLESLGALRLEIRPEFRLSATPFISRMGPSIPGTDFKFSSSETDWDNPQGVGFRGTSHTGNEMVR